MNTIFAGVMFDGKDNVLLYLLIVAPFVAAAVGIGVVTQLLWRFVRHRRAQRVVQVSMLWRIILSQLAGFALVMLFVVVVLIIPTFIRDQNFRNRPDIVCTNRLGYSSSILDPSDPDYNAPGNETVRAFSECVRQESK